MSKTVLPRRNNSPTYLFLVTENAIIVNFIQQTGAAVWVWGADFFSVFFFFNSPLVGFVWVILFLFSKGQEAALTCSSVGERSEPPLIDETA